MSPLEHPAHNAESQEKRPEPTIDRRQLLKALIAAGGAVTAATALPGEWSKPVVEVGVLPAHAQASPLLTPSATPTPRLIVSRTPEPPTPTPTPRPVARVQGCDVVNAAGGIDITPTDTIETFARIEPALEGILLEMEVWVTQSGHPLEGDPLAGEGNPVHTDTTTTDAAGESYSLYYDLNNISPLISPGLGALVVLWTIIDPTVDSRDACSFIVDIV